MPRSIASVEEFYAHALAIEREAAARYREFEAWYADRGDEALAALCRDLARVEDAHFHQLEAECRELRLPQIAAGAHQWLERDSPEAPARELFYRVVNPRQLLEVALQAELDAHAFFYWAANGDSPREVRAAAEQMAGEEFEHVRWVREALARHPAPIDWSQIPERVATPGAFVGAEEAPSAG